MSSEIPVIDLFAGPGGLAEGFSTARVDGRRSFRVRLSIEKDQTAHRTLELRSFFRQFNDDEVPDAYYDYLREPSDMARQELFRRYETQGKRAAREAWNATLGEVPRITVNHRIQSALRGQEHWVLIGGPPCQAYSLVGRSRMKGQGERFAKDPRHFLYQEYLQIIGDHWPSVFVMENVKGLLSSRMEGGSAFARICADLSEPEKALRESGRSVAGAKRYGYKLVALTPRQSKLEPVDIHEPSDFVIRAEDHGIPQARHRVIIVGIRNDLEGPAWPALQVTDGWVSLRDAIGDLPPLRAGLSRVGRALEAGEWRRALESVGSSPWIVQVEDVRIRTEIKEAARQAISKQWNRGAEFVKHLRPPTTQFADEMRDSRLRGFCNHSTRSHIASDLHRYLFAAAFARVHGFSPKLSEFPHALLPSHRNVAQGVAGKMFSDRFRVQLAGEPSTTVTSHISKDGHYFIHYDPVQCRSLTVREAARLQTFPDNYFFEGKRTSQYQQVGNAVPVLLARQIAETVADWLREAKELRTFRRVG